MAPALERYSRHPARRLTDVPRLTSCPEFACVLDERNPPPPAETRRAATSPDQDALRARIAEEVARQSVYPVARRTLALLAEAALVPDPRGPGYRVVDRTGAQRHVTEADGRTVPMDLAALFAELRDRHPALFLPPPPEPEPEPEPPPEPTEDFRAATARFVGAQTVLARSLAARTARAGAGPGRRPLGPRGRSASCPVAGGRRRGAGSSRTGPGAPARRGARPHRLRPGPARRQRVALARGCPGPQHPARRPRPAVVALGLAGLALVALVAVFAGRGGTGEEPVPAETRPQAQAQPPATTAPPSAPDMSPASPEEAPPKPARANEISGPVEVIDTATLRVGGKLVRLFGVEWVRGGQADELTRYLSGRSVTCQPVAGSEARLCSVDGRDLSEVVLFNGGGPRLPEATPDLVAAEDRARAERLGVWAR